MLQANNPTTSNVKSFTSVSQQTSLLSYSFPQRYRDAYINELNHFADLMADKNTVPLVTEKDCIQALAITQLAQESRLKQLPYSKNTGSNNNSQDQQVQQPNSSKPTSEKKFGTFSVVQPIFSCSNPLLFLGNIIESIYIDISSTPIINFAICGIGRMGVQRYSNQYICQSHLSSSSSVHIYIIKTRIFSIY